MHIFMLFLFTFISGLISSTRASQPSDAIDWSHFVEIEDVDISHCVQVIKDLPLSVYFDIPVGRYRTGVLGRHIERRYPELIVKNDIAAVANISIVDTGLVFMHFIAALQAAASYSEVIAGLIGDLEMPARNMFNISQLPHDKMKNPANIRLVREIIDLRARKNRIIIANEKDKTVTAKKTQLYRREQRKRLLDSQHENLLDIVREAQSRFDEQTRLQKIRSDELRGLDDDSQLKFQLLELKVENNVVSRFPIRSGSIHNLCMIRLIVNVEMFLGAQKIDRRN